MAKPRLVRPIVLAVLVAVLAGACSAGVGTPPEDYVPPGGNHGGAADAANTDLLADGATPALDDLRAEIGGERVRALELAIYADSVYLEAQNRDDPARVDIYNWNAGEGVSSGGEKDVAGVDLESALFSLNRVNVAAIPGLVADAPARLGIQGDISSSVAVNRAGGQILTTVFVSTPRGQTGALVADQDGNVVATS